MRFMKFCGCTLHCYGRTRVAGDEVEQQGDHKVYVLQGEQESSPAQPACVVQVHLAGVFSAKAKLTGKGLNSQASPALKGLHS